MPKKTEKKKNVNAPAPRTRTVKNRTPHEDGEERTEIEVAKKKKAPAKNESGARGKRTEQVKAFEDAPRNRTLFHQIFPFVLGILAVFIAICFVLIDLIEIGNSSAVVGSAGGFVRDALCGLFGVAAFAIPAVLVILGCGWYRAVEEDKLLAKNLYGLFFMIFLSTLVHGIVCLLGKDTGSAVGALFDSGKSLVGGGAVGGLLGNPLSNFLGGAGFLLLLVPIVLVFFVFLIGLTPRYVITTMRYRAKIMAERRAEEKQRRREEQKIRQEKERHEREERRAAEAEQRKKEEEERKAEAERKAREAEEEKARIEAEKAAEEARLAEEERLAREAQRAEEERLAEEKRLAEERAREELPPIKKSEEEEDEEGTYISAEELFSGKVDNKTGTKKRGAPEEEINLSEIFTDGKGAPAKKPEQTEDIPKASEVDMELIGDLKPIEDLEGVPEGEDDGIVEIVTDVPAEPEMKAYEFPPIELLAPDTNVKNEDVSTELNTNAKKLVDTLRSFKVGVEEITYSRGPTITRYEIKPAVGVRVRSIANLVDDIALSLATTGVRIEAPIPNKPAVGVEVPNQNPNTVFLRTLIEAEKFANESSRLTACLGADVAGKSVYFNIAKMPHLLIAGATGMGKSVCINSIIVSLLYKARPDEVKLILIDPKKVEFNIYKDIPHLYAPIVSEPTKAAGALASAVAEMERRFELIEEVGVRDIYNYNAVTKDDPDREFMPQMVIIIDELADLMMTAADSVESSICRLAQKARAAGIHIIIGTQRPSVDVITGLIKANIPSRIACTVASQVDSRTIIDIAGAEKLIGRGDMLFAPVGAAKPMRVQGAFVSEGEVEKVVEFIKANNMAAKYNEEFVSRIEEEAAKCASAGKKGGGAASEGAGDISADGLDPKFRAAVEVAVENGRIATSLLQRKLEIGYGRAAKIIDQMEEMGYISAPDGNKPRKVLISKEDFMQMVVNNEIE